MSERPCQLGSAHHILRDFDCAFLSKAIKGCAAGVGLLLKHVIQKHSRCDVERENIDRRIENLQAVENHAASGSDPCQMCCVLDFLPVQPNTFSPSFCFLSESELEIINYHAGTVYVALLNTVCVCETEEEGRSLISTEI